MKVLTGFILAFVAFALAALLVVYTGTVNVAASKPENTVITWLLHTAMRRSVAHHADPNAIPARATEEQVRDGFKVYNETCVYCHGAPGKDPVDIGKGLNPEPPYLADTVGTWTPSQMLWIVKNGVKMTGMPAFGKSHSEAELQAVVAFIQKLPKMTPDQYAEMEKQ
jgi:mono/diheme cytochrome c family protein